MLEPLSEEKRELAALAVKQASRVAKRWERLRPKYADEIQSAAHLASIKAASTFDGTKGLTMDQWACMWTKWEIVGFLKSSYASRFDDFGSIEDENFENDDGDLSHEFDEREMVQSLLSRLTRRQREICELVYVDGMTPHGAGKALGISPTYACHVHKQALERLRGMVAA